MCLRIEDLLFRSKTKIYASILQALSTSALNVQPSGCFMGYCDFVRCLRRANSVNLVRNDKSFKNAGYPI